MNAQVKEKTSEKIRDRREHPVRRIILRSVFYAAVILGLLYLYHYKHFSELPFIYNEF
jgi:hypothetical protein